MTIYKNQLPSTAIPFNQFVREMNEDLSINAYLALSQYENGLPKDYDDYLVFFVEYTNDGDTIFAITKIIDEWLPIEVNDRIRRFTKDAVWEYDNYITIKII